MIKKLKMKCFEFWSANFISTLFERLIETRSIGFQKLIYLLAILELFSLYRYIFEQKIKNHFELAVI